MAITSPKFTALEQTSRSDSFPLGAIARVRIEMIEEKYHESDNVVWPGFLIHNDSYGS
jgi:hypothetical protein